MRNKYGWDAPRATETIDEDLPIWHSPKSNETIKIAADGDAGIYYVERSIPLPSALALDRGGIASQRISPVFVDRNHEAIGERAKMVRAQWLSLPDAQWGTFQSGLQYAINYMARHPGV